MRLSSVQCVLIEEALIRLRERTSREYRDPALPRKIGLEDLVDDIGRALSFSSTAESVPSTLQPSSATKQS